MNSSSRRVRITVALAITAQAVLVKSVLASDSPTFTRDILPILQTKCQECHRPGEIGPMSLLTYAETRPWAKAIQKEVLAKEMPPFHASGPIGRWKDDPRLTDAEIQTFVDWVQKGAVRGDAADAPPAREWPDSGWQFGEPDIIVDMPEHKLRVSELDEHVTFFADHVFPQSMWLRGVVLRMKHNDTVHHAYIVVVPTDFEIPPGNKSPDPIKIMSHMFYTWVPGAAVRLQPEGVGIPVPKGARFALTTHFGPQTEAKTEQVQIGVYAANGTIERIQNGFSVPMFDLAVPPRDPNYVYRKARPFPEDGWVTHFWTHMHLRGKSVQFYFHYPDGESELVFDVPKFDIHWQRYYYLAEPIRVPKDTRVEMVATWDNSAANPNNPNPDVAVGWGKRTIDEMFGGTAYYIPEKTLDEPVIVKDGLVVQAEQTAEVQ